MSFLQRHVPHGIRMFPQRLQKAAIIRLRRWCERRGLMISRRSDYYSPLPSELDLHAHRARWNKPSALRGVRYDLAAIKERMTALLQESLAEFNELPSFESLRKIGYGPGYTKLDAFVLYATLRRLQPKRILEVGSGLSTYYSHLATQRNGQAGSGAEMTCIEPFPYAKLNEIAGVKIVAAPVQEVPLDEFARLQAGDVLFIDSSHVVRLDGDVPYLFLEVLPALAQGVHIHVHDIPFPYNIPYPAEYWTLLEHRRGPTWPIYWTEAMMLQAFLAFNPAFEIELSCPLLRHFEPEFLPAHVPFYQPVSEEPNTFSSIWLTKVQ